MFLHYCKKSLIVLSSITLFIACNSNESNSNPDSSETNSAQKLNYTITNVYPHNIKSFTEGLEWHDSTLYESTGEPGESRLATVALKTGIDIKTIELDKKLFGEGITVLNGKIYQLTYKTEIGFVYDLKTMMKIKEFTYQGEGWGLTNDGKEIIMTNGTSNIYYRDPETFKINKTIAVTNNYGPLGNINEVEYVDGFIYANVFTTNKIVKIDPKNGKVVAEADFTGVIEKYAPSADLQHIDVFNGIAYDSTGKRFFVTGKYWPKIFEVKFN